MPHNTCFFESLPEVPVWSHENGNLVCRDLKTNDLIYAGFAPTMPDGTQISPFEPIKAVSVKDISVKYHNIPNYFDQQALNSLHEDEECVVIPAGTEIYICMKPNGQFYLSLSPQKTPTIGEEIEINSFSILGNTAPAKRAKP